ncbi:hypothetical protein CANARDRAFT_9396 [[Candida] arabinofermentans NRRL YB-2248]|uniref:Protein RMD9, mitochondrial n=1 Tax=[Candida] arabinofermentans NRRL YB-2248 TaxID=983967 RepID=A0A1E4SVT7_9ASCO|nr:hypothetical protein CANARDRAFT_9396 [[Candida] arabinofermentans NRRL YB-2248]
MFSRVFIRRYSLSSITAKIPDHKKPYYKQLLSFDTYIQQNDIQNSSYDNKKHILNMKTKPFWNAIYEIIPLYKELNLVNGLNESRVDSLIGFLRNGLRVQRHEISKMNKNIDYDSKIGDTKHLLNVNSFIKESLQMISNDILNGGNGGKFKQPVKCTSTGLTNLFKAYLDLGLINEASEFWELGKNNENLHDLFINQRVLGVVFQMLISTDFKYDEVSGIYNDIKSSGDRVHGDLQIGMIQICLVKDQLSEALKIFKELSNDVLKDETPGESSLNYLTQAHLSFIGYCNDLKTANLFFESSIKGDLPYLTPLQLNYIKKYMLNTWEISKDFNKIMEIWEKTWQYYELNNISTNSISSSLNDLYFSIFFENYSNFDTDSAMQLKLTLFKYNQIRKTIDEPFFNCLLIKSMIWENELVFKSILKSCDLYNLSKTNVFHRCCLKSSSSLNEISIDDTLVLIYNLLNSNVKSGLTYISNADWFAIRDATINSKNLTNSKIDLYFKLLKKCYPYFNNYNQLSLFKRIDCKLNNDFWLVYKNLNDIDDSDLDLPQLKYFKLNSDILEKMNN